MASNNSKALAGKEQGTSGTNISGGVILFSDYNPKLNGLQAISVYEEMRNDASVNASLEAIKLPIQSADFVADPASDDEADVRIAEEVNAQLEPLLDQYLDEALTHLEFGFCLHEMVFEPMDLGYGVRLGLKKLAYRKQTTVAAWVTKDGQPGITQRTMDGKEASIDAVKLVRITRKQMGDDYQGRSILRTAYRNYYIKDKLYKIDAVGHERHALGVLDITVPKGADEKDKTKMRKLARQVRANQEMYLEHPEGWTVQFLDNKANSMKDSEPSINHHDRQILKNVLAQFLDIGAQGSSGTRNVSEDQSRLFALAIERVAKQIVGALQKSFVEAYMELNYTGRKAPTLRVANLSDDNVPVISEAIKKFVEAGVLHPTKGDENTVRRMVSFGELDDAALDEVFEKADADKERAAEAAKALKIKKSEEDEEAEPVKKASVADRAKTVLANFRDRLYGKSS